MRVRRREVCPTQIISFRADYGETPGSRFSATSSGASVWNASPRRSEPNLIETGNRHITPAVASTDGVPVPGARGWTWNAGWRLGPVGLDPSSRPGRRGRDPSQWSRRRRRAKL